MNRGGTRDISRMGSTAVRAGRREKKTRARMSSLGRKSLIELFVNVNGIHRHVSWWIGWSFYVDNCG